jgi:tRNA dimethylallyltransferase
MLTILGPTACGKTALAAALARMLGGEIISADSRQVYRGMNIGTGKDLEEYMTGKEQIPYHLIDICEAGEKYNVYEYQHDFHAAYSDILRRGKMPILCGGTGLYIESVLKGYRLLKVPENRQLRCELEGKNIEELKNILSSYTSPHNTTDLNSTKRAIRAIEIAKFTNEQAVY